MPEVMTIQKTLSEEQVAAFRIDAYAPGQAADFVELTSRHFMDKAKRIVDMGGGCGHFAAQVHEATSMRVAVLDMDRGSLDVCLALYPHIERAQGDALNPAPQGDEGVVCFNLILHHLVGHNEAATLALQKRALTQWRGKADYIFINEFAYGSYVGNVSGRLIYEITRSSILSAVPKFLGRFFPSLRANTFDVGVRFRGHDEWLKIFRDCGFHVIGYKRGHDEFVSRVWHVLLLKSARRDSFLLRAAS